MELIFTTRTKRSKGKRRVSTFSSGERGVNTTVVCCVNAAGDWNVKPFIIFKGARITQDNAIGLIELFPNVLRGKLDARNFLEGLCDGLLRATCSNAIHKKSLQIQSRHWSVLYGNFIWIFNLLVNDPGFCALMQCPFIEAELDSIPHRVTPSYPTSIRDIGLKAKNYMSYLFKNFIQDSDIYKPKHSDVWIFSDFITDKCASMFLLSSRTTKSVVKSYITQ
jgi:hypothetical protein